jgi:hypothetical protein
MNALTFAPKPATIGIIAGKTDGPVSKKTAGPEASEPPTGGIR